MRDNSDFRAADPYLRQRYGISNNRIPTWLPYAILLALLGGGWLVWSGSHYATPEVRASVVSFTGIDEKHFSITYSISVRHPAIARTCTVVAYDYAANVVGQVTDSPAVGIASQNRTVSIATRTKAVSAELLGCR
jgi:hypothetical protein